MSTNGPRLLPDTPRVTARQEIPIIGQPFTLKTWLIQVMGTCNCSATPEPLLLTGLIAATCPRCQRSFSIQPPDQLPMQIKMTVPNQEPTP